MKKIYSLLLTATMLLIGGNAWAQNVAKIGTTEYATFAEAVDAVADGETIVLIDNVDFGANTYQINKTDVAFTLDLNGYNIKGSKISSASYGILRMVHGTMTIKTSQPNGSIGVLGESKYSLNVSSSSTHDGTIILESGTICGLSYVVNLSSGTGKFIMNGGEIVAEGTVSTIYGMFIDNATSSAEINGGKIIARTSTDNVAVIGVNCKGNLAINDVEMCIQNTGVTSTSYSFTSGTTGEEIIRGGKFVAIGSPSATSSFFSGTTKILGGKFDRDVQTWIPLGEPYLCQDNAGLGTCFGHALTHEVVTDPAATAYIRNVTQGKDYTSISTALAEAADNDELCALQDMNFGVASLVIDKPITFDVNGHNCSANSAVFKLTGGADAAHTLVLTDKAVEKGLISAGAPIQLVGGYVMVDGVKVNATSHCFYEPTNAGNFTIQNVVATTTATTSAAATVYNGNSKKSTVAISNCTFTLDASTLTPTATTSSYPSVCKVGSGTLSIDGGTYKVINTNATNSKYAGIFNGTSAKISINDGMFRVEGAATTKYLSKATTSGTIPNVKIYGGTFDIDPSTWVADGFAVNEAAGIYTIVESNVASVNGTEYASIDEAIAAAHTASYPVVLLHSTKVGTTLTIPAGVTFASTSYTMDLLANTALVLEDGATMPACIANTNFEASIHANNATRYFYSLDKGITACGATETVTLLRDAATTAQINITSGTKTIDFNGHSMTGSNTTVFYVKSMMTGSVDVRFTNGSSTESVVECTNANFQSEGLRVESAGGAVNVTVGHGVTIKGSYGASVWKNVTLNVYGKVVGKRVFAICGNGSTGNGGTTINIYDGAEVESPSTALYHPQVGTLNIYGGEFAGDLSCIEFRGGEANISGGHFYCSKAYADNDDHSGGSSTEGCGFGINPYYDVTVNITGGTFEAYCPFYQAQATGKDKTITTTISDGYFKAINNSKKTIWAETTNKFISGGFYNFTPAAYVVDNKAVVPNDDPVYKFAIADVETAVTFTTAGQWSADGNWSAEATSATPVVIAADCEIPNGVVANVYGLTLNSGKTLIVKKGGKLIVGAEGLVNNADATNLIIEDGAYVAINPVATNATFAATVHHASQTRALTPTEQTASAHGYDKLWEVCANPISAATITFPAGLDVRASRWSNGWVGVNSLSEIATPFGAYMMATNAATSGTDIRWAGTTNGVANQSIAASNTGWYFIGNSYLAPIDIVEFIDNLGANVEKQIYMYKASTETFQPITRTTAGTGSRFDALNSVVEPKSGFFVRATGSATIGLDYTQSVWDALNAKVTAAPGRHKITTPRSEINHTAKMEFAVQSLDDATRYSVLDIFEAAAYTTSKQDDYDFTAFINQSPNINFVAEQYGIQLNTVSLPNLDSLTLAFNSGASTNLRIYFDNVEGTAYYLYDAVTDTYTEIADGTYYDFSVATATGDVMVSDRFMIVADSHLNPTGIEGVGEQSVFVKYIENGNLYIKSNGRVINAHGQVVK